jgi:DNA helicase-2/ATP-dependent DNA helicase PcrA
MDFKTICRKNLPTALMETAGAFIRSAKDRQKLPEDLQVVLDRHPMELPLAEMCLQIYTDYQRALQYRNGLDFEDLIRNALFMLQEDPTMLARLRYKWPYILEDEAQDSSRLQEEILRLLAGEDGNWVRVGDPNQAIFETFTTASPQYLRNFIQEEKVISRPLPASGRSSKRIIALANHLIDWTMTGHPNQEVRQALAPPYIEPVAVDDASPNPPDDESRIQIIPKVYSSEEELNNVARSVDAWLKSHPEDTVAVLAMQNKHMEALSEIMDAKGIPYIELLRSTSTSRQTAAHLTSIIRFLADPTNVPLCLRAFDTWCKVRFGAESETNSVHAIKPLLERQKDPYNLFFPGETDLLEQWENHGLAITAVNQFSEFRFDIRSWLEASVAPIGQLVLIIAMEMFREPGDLALSHKLASYLNMTARLHPEWRLPEFALELSTFAGYQRKLNGFSREDESFDPSRYKGKAVLATLHKAKGLEWDKVYLTSANNFDFPSGAAGDDFLSEKWFIRNHINLTAEALAELDTLLGGKATVRGEATIKDRNTLVGERLRLLFVGITRAKKELVITCNNGMREKAVPAVAVTALAEYLSRQVEETGEKSL